MGFRRIWPDGADHVLTTRATDEQLVRWHAAARMQSMKPHLGLFLARAADHYAKHLEKRADKAVKREERR